MNATSSPGEPPGRLVIWLGDVEGANFSGLDLSHRQGVSALRLYQVRGLRVSASRGLPDASLDFVTDGRFP